MALSSLLSKGAIKLFHGAKKDFNSFDSKFATETAFGKGFSFTPEKNIAENYANITPAQLRKLYGKKYLDAAIERKKDGTPILYEVEANVKDSEILFVRKNFEEQNKKVQEKLKKLIEKENLELQEIDLTKPKFWRQILNLTGMDADKLFTKYGIKASLKDAGDSKLKQVGGKIEYTIYDPKVLKITNKEKLKRDKKNTGGEITMHCNGEGKKKRMKKAVGSVAQKAMEGADSLLSEARKDVVAARGPERVTPVEFEEMAEALTDVKEPAKEEKKEVMKDTTKLVNSLSFAQGGNKKMDKQFVMESLQEVADTPIVESKETVAEFIADLHRTQVDEESRPLLAPKDFEKLTAFASPEPREKKDKGGEIVIEKYDDDSDEAKYLRFEKSYEEAMAKAKSEKSKEIIQKRFDQIKDSFHPNVIANAMMSKETPEDRAFRLAEEKERFGYDMGGILSKEDEEMLEEKKTNMLAEGGMPVDTYDNIRPEEKAAVEASQKPDAEMEKDYAEFVLSESLNEKEQDYLLSALEGDKQLGSIFDKIMDVAGEFAGDGAVNGPGTGTSDSIPARLSDGEFVFTKKAVDQIGVDNLQKMMDDAERAYDGGLMKKYMGGILTPDEMKDMDKDVHNQMLLSNPMPSVRKQR